MCIKLSLCCADSLVYYLNSPVVMLYSLVAPSVLSDEFRLSERIQKRCESIAFVYVTTK